MSLQYIHTSARRGLEPGKSGFCCVARDRDLPLDLGKELEKLSRYEHIAGKSSPVILRHLKVSIRSGNFHVLSRLSDAGADYSKRNNHIAHHLAFLESETSSLPDPATILLFWKNWKSSWTEPPRILTERDQFKIQDLNTSSDSIESQYPTSIANGKPIDTAFTIAEGRERELALHFRNELLTLPAEKRWNVPFTNFILTSDQPNQFLWRGNWEERPLPFEFETQTEPPPSSEPPATTEAPEPKIEPELETSSISITKVAPQVEIPEELTAAHRKRPKRKWTRKRLSRTLNLSLAVLGVLCCGTIAYLLMDFSGPAVSEVTTPITFPLPPEPQSPNPRTVENLSPGSEWAALVDSNRLYEEIERANRLAQRLAALGDAHPQSIADTLTAIKAALETEDGEAQPPIHLPNALVQSTANQWVLDDTLAAEISELGLALAPLALTPFLEQPFRSDPIFTPIFENLHSNRFIPEDAILTLKAVRRAARDRIVQSGIEAVTAAEDYQQQWRSLGEDPIVESIHKLETAFELDPNQGYLAGDDDGILVNPQQIDISVHIKELYERFMLPRASSFKTSPEFRDAMLQASQSHDTVIEVARAIFQVFSAAEPLNRNLESDLARIRAQWGEVFIRDDLMQETIINFNLERLANSKRKLAELQSQFTPETLAGIDSSNRMIELATNAESSILAIDENSGWTLFSREFEK